MADLLFSKSKLKKKTRKCLYKFYLLSRLKTVENISSSAFLYLSTERKNILIIINTAFLQAILKQAHQVGIFKSDPTVTEHISQLEQLAIFIKDSLKNSSESEVFFKFLQFKFK